MIHNQSYIHYSTFYFRYADDEPECYVFLKVDIDNVQVHALCNQMHFSIIYHILVITAWYIEFTILFGGITTLICYLCSQLTILKNNQPYKSKILKLVLWFNFKISHCSNYSLFPFESTDNLIVKFNGFHNTNCTPFYKPFSVFRIYLKGYFKKI